MLHVPGIICCSSTRFLAVCIHTHATHFVRWQVVQYTPYLVYTKRQHLCFFLYLSFAVEVLVKPRSLIFYARYSVENWKTSAVSTTDGWLKLNFASCVVRQTRSLGVLVLWSNWNMVFVNYLSTIWFIMPSTSVGRKGPRNQSEDSYWLYIRTGYDNVCHSTMWSMFLSIAN